MFVNSGTHQCWGFQFLLILDLAVRVIGLGENLLFKSVLGHCVKLTKANLPKYVMNPAKVNKQLIITNLIITNKKCLKQDLMYLGVSKNEVEF